MNEAAEQFREERDKRQHQLDAIDRLVEMEPLPVPESLSEWNREYSRLKVGEAEATSRATTKTIDGSGPPASGDG